MEDRTVKLKGPRPSASDQEAQLGAEDSITGDVQIQILQELRRVSKRLDVVQEEIAVGGSQKHHKKDMAKLSKKSGSHSKSKSKVLYSTSDLSDDDFDLPTLSEIRASGVVQHKIDNKIGSLT